MKNPRHGLVNHVGGFSYLFREIGQMLNISLRTQHHGIVYDEALGYILLLGEGRQIDVIVQGKVFSGVDEDDQIGRAHV